MPKYKHKFSSDMKQHQVDHLTEQYAGFLDQMDAEHEARIQQMKDEHKEHKQRLIEQHEKQKEDLLAEATFDVKKNTSKQPKEIAPGIVILPGDYYVEGNGINGPFGISAADLETSYEKV